MEEDAGKNIHDAHGDASLVDLNRAGVPLLEIVSEPDIYSAAEAGAYLRTLRAIVQYLEVCDGNMEEGSFRCDANVSLRPQGTTDLGVKVEIKNMNSFRAVERALSHEIARQADILSEGGTIVQETRLWDADREVTRSMRTKEFAHDYRYFPDPDLLPLVVGQDWIDEIRSSLPELPTQRRDRFISEYELTEDGADELTVRKDVADYFEEAVKRHRNPKSLSNWIRSELMRVVHERRLDDALSIAEWPVPPADLGRLVALIDEGTISGKIAKTVWTEMLSSRKSPDEIVEEQDLVQVTDRGTIESAVDGVLAAHPEKVAEYQSGKEKLLGFFVGQVMKATKGAANPALVNELLKAKLAG
jgi:aspartyl-tRNA(Asn)/glutamyl-tRNA(Gln) amidotransferase subunit B